MSHDEMLTRFLHHRLDAYHVARELAVAAHGLAATLPRGFGKLSDNLRRAAIAVPLLVAEGANRRSAGQKRQRFEEAQGECAECAAAAELAVDLGVGDRDAAMTVWRLASREAAMLNRLVRRHR